MYIYIYIYIEAELLERAVAMREVLGLGPGRGGHKKLCGRRAHSDYLSFRIAVKIQRFYTLYTHDTKPRPQKNTPYKRITFWNWISVRFHQISLTHFLLNDL